MKVVGDRIRCDGCARLVPERGAEGKTFRGFFMGPSINPSTGEPDGRFPGIARAGAPDQMVQLHACPGCKPKIQNALTAYDFSNLPDGPLKKIVRQLLTGDRLRNLKLH